MYNIDITNNKKMTEPIPTPKQRIDAAPQDTPVVPRADQTPGDQRVPKAVEQERLVNPTLEAARRGDAAAFQAIVTPHIEAMRRLILSIVKKPEDADDVLQEALIAVHRNVAKLTNVRGYCMAAARTRALNKVNPRRHRMERATTGIQDVNPDPDGPTFEPVADEYAEIGQTPERATENAELRGNILTCIQMLPEQDQQLILMADVQGLTQAEISKQLGIGQSTTSRKLREAREKLQQLLKSNTMENAA